MRVGARVLVAFVTVAALATGTLGTAAAVPNGTTHTVDAVLVNKTGGITASGTVDCTVEVEAYFAPDPVPAETLVLANQSWAAWQKVGRKTMLQATHQNHYANPCFDNRTGSTGAPYPWMTSQYDSTDTPFYVYSPNGAFKTGAIHIDLKTDGGYLFVDGEYLGRQIEVYHLTGFDLRATRS